MIINRKPETVILTQCDICGEYSPRIGRLDLSIDFDKTFIDEDLNSKISLSVCPSCIKKITKTFADMVRRTTETSIETRVELSNKLDSILDGPQKVLDNPEEMVEVKGVVEYVEAEPIPQELSEDDKETLLALCDMYKNTIKDPREFIDDFVKEFPVYSTVLYTKTVEESMEFIRLIVRDNSEYYRLKKPFNGGHWYMHKYLNMERAQRKKEESEVKIQEENLEEETELCKKRNWTEEEDNFLKDNYYTLGAEKCAKMLNRSVVACRSRISFIGMVKKPRKMRRWSKKEEEFLEENHKKLGLKVCAEKLNRTVSSCENKLISLKLTN